MKSARLHPDEPKRIEALEALNILDTLPEEDFNQIVLLASQICDTPIALISLVDKDRQWFKARVGLSASETSRDVAFCAHVILQNEVFSVNEASRDERFLDNPLVTGDPRVEFYAGAPLVSPSGFPIGTVCVIDHKKRELSANQIASLKCLSNQVTRLLELRHQVKELEHARENSERQREQLRFILDSIPHMIGFWGADLINLNSNDVYSKFFGKQSTEIRGKHMRELLGPDLYEKNRAHIEAVLSGKTVSFERTLPHSDGTMRQTLASYSPLFKEGKVVSFLAVVIDVTEIKNLEAAKTILESRLSEFEIRSRKQVNLLLEVADIANQAKSVEEAISNTLRSLCVAAKMTVGHAYLTEPNSTTMKSSGLWYFENEEKFIALKNVTESKSVQVGIDLPGRVLQTSSPVWIDDVAIDRNFPRSEISKNLGVHSAFAFPLFFKQKTVAVLELFSDCVMKPRKFIK